MKGNDVYSIQNSFVTGQQIQTVCKNLKMCNKVAFKPTTYSNYTYKTLIVSEPTTPFPPLSMTFFIPDPLCAAALNIRVCKVPPSTPPQKALLRKFSKLSEGVKIQSGQPSAVEQESDRETLYV